jgi:pSer/pThr/pTyr-binding forkhead associated (FHA) protein
LTLASPGPTPVLEVLSGDLAGRSYEILGDTFTIGRREDCDLVLPKKYVSRVHAEVVRSGEGFLVRGVSEKNPIVVSGREVDRHELEDGDVFELGGIRFRFRTRPGRSADEEAAPSGPIVFGAEDAPGSPPQQEAPAPAPEKEDEETGEIDVTKLRAQAAAHPDDPFADDSGPAVADAESPEAQATRERFLRALVLAGLIGIAITIAYLVRQALTPPKLRTFEKEVAVAPEETKLVEEGWAAEDPPTKRRSSSLTGQPYVFHDDDVARAEWVLPHLERTTLFLVTGKRSGETSFDLELESGNRVRLKITVRGSSQHAQWQAARRKRLEALDPSSLKQEAVRHLESGRTLKKERDTPGKEHHYRRALREFELAHEAFSVLSDVIYKIGQIDPDFEKLRGQAEVELKAAREEHERAVQVKRNAYEGHVKRGQKNDAVLELALLLRVMGDPCDVEYQRFAIFYERYFGAKVRDRVSCLEREP